MVNIVNGNASVCRRTKNKRSVCRRRCYKKNGRAKRMVSKILSKLSPRRLKILAVRKHRICYRTCRMKGGSNSRCRNKCFYGCYKLCRKVGGSSRMCNNRCKLKKNEYACIDKCKRRNGSTPRHSSRCEARCRLSGLRPRWSNKECFRECRLFDDKITCTKRCYKRAKAIKARVQCYRSCRRKHGRPLCRRRCYPHQVRDGFLRRHKVKHECYRSCRATGHSDDLCTKDCHKVTVIWRCYSPCRKFRHGHACTKICSKLNIWQRIQATLSDAHRQYHSIRHNGRRIKSTLTGKADAADSAAQKLLKDANHCRKTNRHRNECDLKNRRAVHLMREGKQMRARGVVEYKRSRHEAKRLFRAMERAAWRASGPVSSRTPSRASEKLPDTTITRRSSTRTRQ